MPAPAAIVGGATVRTGRRLDDRPRPKQLRWSDYVDDARHFVGLPSYVHHAWGIPSSTISMYGNDKLGDCTCAAIGHQTHVWHYDDALRDASDAPTLADVLALYWATGKQDDGRMMRDVLDYWMAHPGEFPSMPPPLAYVQIDVTRASTIRQATYLFGGVYVGLWLPVAAQSMTTWEIDPDTKLTGDYEPGGWGGHAINLMAYSTGRVEYGGVTWGSRIGVGQSFLHAYCDEAYAIIHPSWLDERGESPEGFDLDQLRADLAKIKAA